MNTVILGAVPALCENAPQGSGGSTCCSGVMGEIWNMSNHCHTLSHCREKLCASEIMDDEVVPDWSCAALWLVVEDHNRMERRQLITVLQSS